MRFLKVDPSMHFIMYYANKYLLSINSSLNAKIRRYKKYQWIHKKSDWSSSELVRANNEVIIVIKKPFLSFPNNTNK